MKIDRTRARLIDGMGLGMRLAGEQIKSEHDRGLTQSELEDAAAVFFAFVATSENELSDEARTDLADRVLLFLKNEVKHKTSAA